MRSLQIVVWIKVIIINQSNQSKLRGFCKVRWGNGCDDVNEDEVVQVFPVFHVFKVVQEVRLVQVVQVVQVVQLVRVIQVVQAVQVNYMLRLV